MDILRAYKSARKRGYLQTKKLIRLTHVCILVHARGPHKWSCKEGHAIFLRFNKCFLTKNVYYMNMYKRYKMKSTVLIFYGSSGIGDKVRRNLCYLICLRHFLDRQQSQTWKTFHKSHVFLQKC